MLLPAPTPNFGLQWLSCRCYWYKDCRWQWFGFFFPLLHFHRPECPLLSTGLSNVGITSSLAYMLPKHWQTHHPNTDSGCTHILFSLYNIELLRSSSADRELTCPSVLGIQILYHAPSPAIEIVWSRTDANRKLTEGVVLQITAAIWVFVVVFFS